MNFKEIETKYNAENISLTEFIAFCNNRDPVKSFNVSGYDHFYDKTGDDESFYRHRVGENFNQLTFKRKTVDNNNFIRTEHNINLKRKVGKDQVAALCAEHGYKYNTSIFKTAFVYQYDNYSLVWYSCYNTEMKELGRFVEIEMSEDHEWTNDQEAWDLLVALEKLCKSIGVSPQARIKKSLFELFRKNTAK